eukprot:g56150.t1
MALQAALEAFRVGQHDVLTKFVANYEGKSLDLSSKNLGYVGASAVAKGLLVNKTLVEFDIRGNKIGPAGAAAIANMLKVNKTLVEFDIRRNKIGPAGAAAIANMLKMSHEIAHCALPATLQRHEWERCLLIVISAFSFQFLNHPVDSPWNYDSGHGAASDHSAIESLRRRWQLQPSRGLSPGPRSVASLQINSIFKARKT